MALNSPTAAAPEPGSRIFSVALLALGIAQLTAACKVTEARGDSEQESAETTTFEILPPPLPQVLLTLPTVVPRPVMPLPVPRGRWRDALRAVRWRRVQSVWTGWMRATCDSTQPQVSQASGTTPLRVPEGEIFVVECAPEPSRSKAADPLRDVLRVVLRMPNTCTPKLISEAEKALQGLGRMDNPRLKISCLPSSMLPMRWQHRVQRFRAWSCNIPEVMERYSEYVPCAISWLECKRRGTITPATAFFEAWAVTQHDGRRDVYLRNVWRGILGAARVIQRRARLQSSSAGRARQQAVELDTAQLEFNTKKTCVQEPRRRRRNRASHRRRRLRRKDPLVLLSALQRTA